MRRGTFLGAGVAWALAVVVIALTCWGAITAAGDQVASRPFVPVESVPIAPATTTSPPSAPPTSTAPAPSGSPTVRPTTPAATAAPPRPAASEPDSPQTRETTSDPVERTPDRAPSGADIVRSTQGGTAAFSCTDDDLVYRVRPAEGWRADVKREGEGEVEVRFIRGGDQVRLEAACVEGRPVVADDRHSGGQRDDD